MAAAPPSRGSSRGRGSVLGARQTSVLALTYANEWEDYTITEEALNDPTFRDELIALGLDPETGQGRGRLSALLLDAGRNTTDNLLDAKRGYVANVHLETAGQWLGGDFDYREVSARGALLPGARPHRGRRGARSRRVDRRLRGRRRTSSRSSSATSSAARRTSVDGGALRCRRSARGLPIGGLTFMNFSTEVRVPARRQVRRGAVPRRRQRLDQLVGLQHERPALRCRVRPALQHANRSDSPRRWLAAQPDSGPAGERRAAEARNARSISASARRSEAMVLIRRIVHVVYVGPGSGRWRLRCCRWRSSCRRRHGFATGSGARSSARPGNT